MLGALEHRSNARGLEHGARPSSTVLNMKIKILELGQSYRRAGLLDEPGSSTNGRRRAHPIGGHHKRAEPASFDRFSHGHAWRQALEMVVFVIQSLSRHGIEVV